MLGVPAGRDLRVGRPEEHPADTSDRFHANSRWSRRLGQSGGQHGGPERRWQRRTDIPSLIGDSDNLEVVPAVEAPKGVGRRVTPGPGAWQAMGMFEGFVQEMVNADGLDLFVRHGGAGPAVLLIHGRPRTSATWHRIAPQLVALGRTVVCADLPGYGRSGKPTAALDHAPHSKRAGARHLLAAMRALGHDRFAVVGHDRGSYYALRLALDHPEAVSKVALLNCFTDQRTPRSCRYPIPDSRPPGGTGSSSLNPRSPSGSSPPILMPGTAATRR